MTSGLFGTFNYDRDWLQPDPEPEEVVEDEDEAYDRWKDEQYD